MYFKSYLRVPVQGSFKDLGLRAQNRFYPWHFKTSLRVTARGQYVDLRPEGEVCVVSDRIYRQT